VHGHFVKKDKVGRELVFYIKKKYYIDIGKKIRKAIVKCSDNETKNSFVL
jgi:DNA-directed RNA polymerase subunit E'/Rpb7